MKNLSDKWILSPHTAEVKVQYSSKDSDCENPVLCTPEEVDVYLRAIWNHDILEVREEFVVLFFNNDRRCLGWSKISMGSRKATVVDPSQVLVLALLTNASSVIVSHNHPSGSTKPSTSDIQLTKRLYDGLFLIGLQLDDHIILAKNGYYSFRNSNQSPFDKRPS